MKIQMDIQKVKKLLQYHQRTQAWLAKELKISRQLLNYHIRNKTVKGAELVAPVFGLNAKDLIK